MLANGIRNKNNRSRRKARTEAKIATGKVENTHAYNKSQRRLANKKLGLGNPQNGEPVSGELTPTEIAHRERRKARRIAKCKDQLHEVRHKLHDGALKMADLSELHQKEQALVSQLARLTQ